MPRMPSIQYRRELDALPFRVDPHMLEDLGLNLYSSLSRVLVEFIANAYDADASRATISMDFAQIGRLRADMRQEWKQREAEAIDTGGADVARSGFAGGRPLARRGLHLNPGRWTRHVP